MASKARTRRPTMADVARVAGVSAMTVSYAYAQPGRVSAEATAKVRQAAAHLGYPGPHPGARSLRRGSAGSLGVVLGEHLTYAFDDPQAGRFLAGVAQVCADQGVGLTLVPLGGTLEDSTRVRQAAVDGFVVWTTADDDPVLDAVVATGLPAVVHGGPPRPGLPEVGIDDHAAARAIGQAAFAGAEQPAILAFPVDRSRRAQLLHGPDPDSATFPVTRRRLHGLRDAWQEAGGTWSDMHVAVCSRNAAGHGEQVAGDLLRAHPRIDALAAMSDELALGARQTTARLGIAVPDDLALTGWDDTPAADAGGLTTVRQDLRSQGELCARIALDLQEPLGTAQDPPPAPWQVVHRTSTRHDGLVTPGT